MLSRRSLAIALALAGGSARRFAGAETSREPARRAASLAHASASALVFPRDFGAHPDARIEWWYVTGSLEAAARLWGFQITFFRAATGIASSGRFAAGQIVFAHAAVSDLEGARLRHDQRIRRISAGNAEASLDDTALLLRGWQLDRAASPGLGRYRIRADSDLAGFRFDLAMEATQPVLLQGEAGVSAKGPDAAQSSRYYSEPQLPVRGTLRLDRNAPIAVTGRAWLDHEWSDSLLDPAAVGWDWIGMNLDDGAALTAFRMRRADGSALWAGGSIRRVGGTTRNFSSSEVSFVGGRRWTSPASKASYPVRWTITTPAGRFDVVALLDDQELDSRASTGAIYWEGLSQLLDENGRQVGRGYLEMTGYAARLKL